MSKLTISLFIILSQVAPDPAPCWENRANRDFSVYFFLSRRPALSPLSREAKQEVELGHFSIHYLLSGRLPPRFGKKSNRSISPGVFSLGSPPSQV